jgi:DNA-directed RNA polymerase specialized sigma24 family protein
VSPDLGIDAAARNRAALETFVRHEDALRRTALRYSLCADDADEALARGFEILLRKAPSEEPRQLVRWTHTVVKHEALAVRGERERVLAGPAAAPAPGGEDWTAMIPSATAGPAEQAERHDAVARTREALASLKPAELRALTLLAAGYSYREIVTITGFSATKVNRSLAEGRERFRGFLARAAAGGRCAELGPLISAYADGEAGVTEAASVREHLRACAHCRATLRTYRAAPRAAAALAPTLPLHRSLLDRAHDAAASLASRLGGGGGDSTLSGVAASGGSRGAGMTALAKVLAVCAGTVGGAAACVAGGVVPAPLALAPAEPHHVAAAPAHHHKRPVRLIDDVEPGGSGAPAYETDPPAVEAPAAEPAPEPAHHKHHRESEQRDEPAAAVEEAAPEAPATEAGAVAYAPPPEATAVAAPEASPASSASASSPAPSSSSAGSAAGEFGP